MPSPSPNFWLCTFLPAFELIAEFRNRVAVCRFFMFSRARTFVTNYILFMYLDTLERFFSGQLLYQSWVPSFTVPLEVFAENRHTVAIPPLHKSSRVFLRLSQKSVNYVRRRDTKFFPFVQITDTHKTANKISDLLTTTFNRGFGISVDFINVIFNLWNVNWAIKKMGFI